MKILLLLATSEGLEPPWDFSDGFGDRCNRRYANWLLGGAGEIRTHDFTGLQSVAFVHSATAPTDLIHDSLIL